jgi:hypothetical protein
MATLGILHFGKKSNQHRSITSFKNELDRWVGGTGVTIDYDPADALWSDDDPALLDANADTLATNPRLDLIIAAGGSASVYAVQNAQSARRTNTNVVFTTFSQTTAPASNMCGVCAHTSDTDLQRMIILHSKLHASSYGVLENIYRRDYDPHKFDAWKQSAGVTLDPRPVLITRTDSEAQVIINIQNAFARWRGMNITAALVCADPIFNDHRKDIKDAAKPGGGHKIKTMHQWHDFVSGGYGDYAYGTTLREAYELAAKAAKDILVLGESPQEVGVLETHATFKEASAISIQEHAASLEDVLRNAIESRPYTSVMVALGLGWFIGRMGRHSDY